MAEENVGGFGLVQAETSLTLELLGGSLYSAAQ